MNFSELSTYNLIIVSLASLMIGISKAGIRGLDVFQVVLMALVFGSKVSTGVVLPLLCLADVMATIYYKKSVNWEVFRSLLPSMIIGVLLGLGVGHYLPEILFKKIMGLIVLVTLLILIRNEFLNKKNPTPNSTVYTYFMGLIAGFTTMIGNLAGAFANIYFLGLRVPKAEFLGTVSWVFLFINLFKMPLQILVWKNINTATLKIDLLLAIFVIIGFMIGVKIVGKIKEDNFRKVVLILTILGSVFLLAI